MSRIYYATEFTGLHAGTTLISIGLVTDDDKEFYAELTDYDDSQVDDWIQEHVLGNLLFNEFETVSKQFGNITFVKGTSEEVGTQLQAWLRTFNHVELWSDVCHYDMVLFQELFGGASGVPGNVDYICYDIATVFKMFGIDPNISREAFIDKPIEGVKRNALHDAKVIRACYDKLQRNRDMYRVVLK